MADVYTLYLIIFGPVVQLVRMLACHARGRRFKSVLDRQNSGITLRSYREMKTYSPLLICQQLVDEDESSSHSISFQVRPSVTFGPEGYIAE